MTMRLSRYDKSVITSDLCGMVFKLPWSVEFPIEYKKRTDLLDCLYDDALHQAWHTIKIYNEECVRPTTRHKFRLFSHENHQRATWLLLEFGHPPYGPHHNEGRYNATPRTLDKSYPFWDVLFEWGTHRARAKNEAVLAQRYIENGVEKCTSFGQVARILPGVHQYLSSRYAESLQYAERKSRVPIGFVKDYSPELRDGVMNIIAKASLLGTVTSAPYGEETIAKFSVQEKKTPTSSL